MSTDTTKTAKVIPGMLRCPVCHRLVPDDYDAACCDCGYEVDSMFPATEKSKNLYDFTPDELRALIHAAQDNVCKIRGSIPVNVAVALQSANEYLTQACAAVDMWATREQQRSQVLGENSE